MINKYSSWVAAAVNMRIISIKDLTDLLDTSFASAYTVVEEDDDAVAAAEDDATATATDDSVYTVASEGASCKNADYFGDGFCDDANNVEACKYDGGDCCASTCGVGYVVSSECGADHYNCLDTAASDYVATSEEDDAEGDDDGDDGGGGYGYGAYGYGKFKLIDSLAREAALFRNANCFNLCAFYLLVLFRRVFLRILLRIRRRRGMVREHVWKLLLQWRLLQWRLLQWC